MQPRRQGRVAAKAAESLERPDERLLGEFARQLVVSGHAVGQAIHAVDMRVVQSALGGGLPRAHAGDQLTFVHAAPYGGQSPHWTQRGAEGVREGEEGAGGETGPQRGSAMRRGSAASREVRVPIKKYSATSRSSKALNRAIDLAATTSPRAPNWPCSTSVRATARSRTPMARPRDTSIAPVPRASSPRSRNTESSRTDRTRTMPRPQT